MNTLNISSGKIKYSCSQSAVNSANYKNEVQSSSVLDNHIITPQDKTDLASSSKPEKELTVLFYMNGQYPDIGSQVVRSMFQLESAGPSDDVNIVAQLGRMGQNPQDVNKPDYVPLDHDWTGIKRFEVCQGENPKAHRLSIDELLKLQKEIPNNPVLYQMLEVSYKEIKDEGKAKYYAQKAKELGLEDVMDGSKESKRKYVELLGNKEYQQQLLEVYAHAEPFFKAKAEINIFKSKVIQDLGKDAKMQDPMNLETFISMGMEKYPAKHYMVVVFSHGGAWHGASNISPVEITKAIKNGVSEANKGTKRNDKIDILDLNTCYMGNLESIYEMKDVADITIASEDITNTSAFFKWGELLEKTKKSIIEKKSFEPENFVHEKVEYFSKQTKEMEIKGSDNPNVGFSTISAIRNKEISDLTVTLREFIKSCKTNGVTNNQFFTAVKKAKNYPGKCSSERGLDEYAGLRDLKGIMESIIKTDEIHKDVKEKAKQVIAIFDRTIIDEFHVKSNEGSNGLTLWVPASETEATNSIQEYKCNVPSFLKESGWFDFICDATRRVNVPREIMEKHNDDFAALRSKINELNDQYNSKLTGEEEKNKILKEIELLNIEKGKKLEEFAEITDYTNF
jgi:hypothetical protein